MKAGPRTARWSSAAVAGALAVVTALFGLGMTSTASAAGSSDTQPSLPAAQAHSHRVVYPTVEIVHGRADRNPRAGFANTSTSPVTYQGGNDNIGVTTGPPRVYLVFWGSQWGTQTGTAPNATFSGDPSGMAPRLQQMFTNLGSGELWSGVMTQYCQGVTTGATSCPATGVPHVPYPTGGALAGVVLDPAILPTGGATGAQLAAEAVKAAGMFGNTTAASNRNAQYMIVSPHGTHPDGFNSPLQWCAWHDWNGDYGVSSPNGDIAFTNLPYLTDVGTSCGANFVNNSGALDGVTIVSGHEYAETITDQNPIGGWFDSLSQQENADKCAWISPGSPGGAGNVTMGSGSFPMQSTWSNDTTSCLLSHAVVGSSTTNDFSISASPASQTAAPGASASYSVTVTPTAGYSGTVALSLASSTGVAGSTFIPASLSFTNGSPSSATSTLQVTASSSTGTWPLTITADDGAGLHHTAGVSLVVAKPDFSISASPSSVQVRRGKSASYTVTVTRTGGYTGTVSLTLGSSAGVASKSFSPASLSFTTASPSSATSTLRVTATNTTGTFSLTINATDGTTAHSTAVSLRVK